MTTTSVATARQAFPRGLLQPEGGFRFGADALLLAAFAAPLAGNRVLDLGTGCGPAALALLLARDDPDTLVTGLDKDPAMVAAAAENAGRLGLTDRCIPLEGDVRAIRDDPRLPPEAFDLVLANPPFRHPGSGRRPEAPGRDAARFELDGGLAAFAAAATYALRNKGQLACVHLAERLTHIITALTSAKLEIKRILPVAARLGEPARQVLVLARKNGRPGLRLEAPLALYAGTGAQSRLTEAALRFCPFLRCNAGPEKTGGDA